MNKIFTQYYQNNYWKNDESVSGHGSTLEATAEIRRVLPLLFEQYNIQSILDIPCGDLNWMGRVVLGNRKYIGADIVEELIERNKKVYDLDSVEFLTIDITKDDLPRVDLILCRDLLGHFSNFDVRKALINIKLSRSKYLLATTFPSHETSGDIETGQWRPINLAQYFGLPDPLEYINERCTAGGGKFSDKSLGLWNLQEV